MRAEPILLFGVALFFYGIQGLSFPVNGDTYLYAHALTTLEGPRTHMGYYVLLSWAHGLLGPVGATPLQTVTLLSQVFGALGVAFMFLLAKRLLGDVPSARVAAFTLLLSGAYWEHAIQGEVYTPQTALALLAMLSMYGGHPMAAGMAFLGALAITPTSALAGPVLVYLLWRHCPGRSSLVRFGLPLLLGLGGVGIWRGEELLDVVRGGIYLPNRLLEDATLGSVALRVGGALLKALVKSFGPALLLACWGVLVARRTDRGLLVFVAALLLPFSLYLLNLNLFSGCHLLLAFIGVSLLVARGVPRGKGEVPVLVLLALSSWVLLIGPSHRDAREYSRVVHALSERFRERSVLIADFTFGSGVLYLWGEETSYSQRIGVPEAYSPRGNAWLERERLPRLFTRFPFGEILSSRTLYYAETRYWPAPLVQALTPEGTLRMRGEKKSRMEEMFRWFTYLAQGPVVFESVVDSPLYPVYRVGRMED